MDDISLWPPRGDLLGTLCTIKNFKFYDEGSVRGAFNRETRGWGVYPMIFLTCGFFSLFLSTKPLSRNMSRFRFWAEIRFKTKWKTGSLIDSFLYSLSWLAARSENYNFPQKKKAESQTHGSPLSTIPESHNSALFWEGRVSVVQDGILYNISISAKIRARNQE